MKKWLTLFGKALMALVIALCLAATIAPPFLDTVYYKGDPSAHFDGGRFFNPAGDDTSKVPIKGSRWSFMMKRALGNREAPDWPDEVSVMSAKPQQLPPLLPGEMRAIWVGHATVLVQVDGLNILTDPVWSDRVGPMGIGPKRAHSAGIAFDDLPKIDIVLVSHNHYDHMDLATIKRLWERDKPQIITSLGNDSLIGKTGAQVRAIDWGDRVSVKPGVDVIVTRNHHWSSRWMVDRNRALWSSFVVTLPGGNLFFAGDTGFGDGEWGREGAAHGPVRLAILPIGAFRFEPGQMSIPSHIGPIQAERIFASLGARFALPVHWGTFKLSDEARETPPKMLAEVIKCAGYGDQGVFAAQIVGRPLLIPPLYEKQKEMPPAPDKICLNDPAITALP